MDPKFNLWIEIEGEVVLSKWRVSLLEWIGRKGSISGAAEEMGVPYRRAWQRLHEMEKRLGKTLVQTEIGGAQGGGAELTEVARDLMKRFREFSDGFDEVVQERFSGAFAE